MRGEGTTYDQIAFSHCCCALGTGINSSAHSEVGAAPQMPSADEEVQTKEQRSLCKMPRPTVLALDLLQHRGPLAAMVTEFREYQRIPFIPRDTVHS